VGYSVTRVRRQVCRRTGGFTIGNPRYADGEAGHAGGEAGALVVHLGALVERGPAQ